MTGGPPRLHVTPEFIDLLEIADQHLDRSVYGPLDFFGRVARIPDLVRMWHAILGAAPGYAETGTVPVRTGAENLEMLLYAQRYVPTDVGPRLRVLCQNMAGFDRLQLRVDMLDLAVSRAAIAASGTYGVVLETRWPTTCPLQWLTGWAPNLGHGVATGQTPGMHPDDIVRVPGLVEKARTEGVVRDSVRVRKFGGGWMTADFVAQLLDPEVSPTLALSLVTIADDPA
ncbi:hypothetical protein ACFYTQ_07715 [Nocardia sp. NPDC004068]|uniref:hypothetical protein n=1 Tax=Nocardia sp. NPDC004068 TaxID=3364303 RepID=UPI0036A292AC